MITKLWKEYLLGSRALRAHPDPILTPAPPLPNPFPQRLDDGSPSGLQDALDTIEKHLKEAGATDTVIETTLKGFPYALGEALEIKQNAATQPTHRDIERQLRKRVRQAQELADFLQKAHPLYAELLQDSDDQHDAQPITSDFPSAIHFLNRVARAAQSAQRRASQENRRDDPGRVHLYSIVLFLAESWIAANERGPEAVGWDSDRHDANFVSFAFDVIHGLHLTTDRGSVSSVARQVADALRTVPA